MMEGITERAHDLGRQISQTDEYQALHRARAALNDDREIVTQLNRIVELESEITGMAQRGEEPGEELRKEYEETFNEVQSSPIYQRLVAAQSNFDKILMRVNEEISRGMEAGAQSRIILPS